MLRPPERRVSCLMRCLNVAMGLFATLNLTSEPLATHKALFALRMGGVYRYCYKLLIYKVIFGYMLLVVGFEVQACWPAHGQGQLHGFTHDAASDEKFCAEMVALS